MRARGNLDRLMDLLVHGQDIAIPLGITRDMPLTATRIAVERIWNTNAPFHARRRFAGYRLAATDDDWTSGHGPLITGPLAALLLLITGREAALPHLTGAGLDRLRTQRPDSSLR
nr:maleylpyruvate isomerase family mycothiol-dependent enzyme [Nocardia otitidiscaviarum]